MKELYDCLARTTYPVYAVIGEGEEGIVYRKFSEEFQYTHNRNKVRKARFQIILYSRDFKNLLDMEEKIHSECDYVQEGEYLLIPLPTHIPTEKDGLYQIILEYYLLGGKYG